MLNPLILVKVLQSLGADQSNMVALISLFGSVTTAIITLIGVVITVKASTDKFLAELDKHSAIQDERIANISKKLDEKIDQIDEIPVLKQRIAVLEGIILKLEKAVFKED